MAELSTRVQRLMQPHLRSIEPYDPNFTATRINLSANENTHPLPASVREAVDEVLAATPLNRYPDPMSDALRDEIAAVNDVSRAQVCVGNGGDELLYNFLLAFGGRNRSVLICPPCFSEYAFFAQLTETNVRTAGRDPRTLTLDEEALLACARTCDLVIVTSPKQPNRRPGRPRLIERVCHACHGLAMVDEAYIEFAGEDASALPLLAHLDNLVILRTLSKAYGAAGTRCGYVMAATDIIDALSAVRQIYSVNVLTQQPHSPLCGSAAPSSRSPPPSSPNAHGCSVPRGTPRHHRMAEQRELPFGAHGRRHRHPQPPTRRVLNPRARLQRRGRS